MSDAIGFVLLGVVIGSTVGVCAMALILMSRGDNR